MHLEHEYHVAETLDEVVAIELCRRDHDVTALLDLHIEIIGAAFVCAAHTFFTIAGDCPVIGNHIHQPIIIDVQLRDEVIPEFHLLADLAEMRFFKVGRVPNQFLLRQRAL
ncbi:hypothetical protein D3C80_1894580 [compost metagenome]